MRQTEIKCPSGLFEEFPELGIHATENFKPSINTRKLEESLVHTLYGLNNGKFTFEEFGTPTIPGCTIVFEFGIADSNGFTFIDKDEVKRILTAIDKKIFDIMDFFCAIRYYRDYTTRKKPQKFDYYLARFVFSEEATTLDIFHERGPRYLSPTDVLEFLVKKINDTTARGSRKALKRTSQPTD